MPMTPSEHFLMLAMFSRQAQAIKALLEILESRDIISGDDARAFQATVMMNPAMTGAIVDETALTYKKVAKTLNLHTGIAI